MRVLVTGCAGFIGARVTELLLDAEHNVVGVDNLNSAYDVRLKQWRLARLLPRAGFTFKQLDIADQVGLRAVFEADGGSPAPPDAVVNLAARAGVPQSVANPWVYVETNVAGTLNLLDLCREFSVGKFVLASTSSLYGTQNTLPFSEDANTDHPLSPYAASKKAAEAMSYTYHSLYNIDVTVLRYFTVYGPAGRPDMSLFRFVQWISEDRPVVVFGDGRQSRDFTYVDDVARGTVAALRTVGYEVINLGGDEPIVLLEAVRLIEDLVGKRAALEFRPPHPADMPSTWANVVKARSILEWAPQIHFEDGVRRLGEWYTEQRAWAKDIATWQATTKSGDVSWNR